MDTLSHDRVFFFTMRPLSVTQANIIRCTAPSTRSQHQQLTYTKKDNSARLHDPIPQYNKYISRRSSIFALSLLTIPTLGYTLPQIAAAEEQNTSSLPKQYTDTVRSLIQALKDSIDADINGEPEREVRRKADPAKDLVRQFMTRWKDNNDVKDSESYIQIVDAIQQLGQFYISKGQRARLDTSVANSLLLKLDKADMTLPPAPEKKSLLPF